MYCMSADRQYLLGFVARRRSATCQPVNVSARRPPANQPSQIRRTPIITGLYIIDTGSLCLAVDSTHTAVGLFRSLVRRSGTHCQMNSEIRRVMSTASNSSLKQSCSALTSVTSASEVNFNVMRSINSRFTYLLTYLLIGN